ncbi:HNH endonuclease signature motif containing protein [Phocoenobacter skyensis]|uniref:HNH endonuclease n=1 Tax=Phocoenobacter skyensis TaxID=97481 RepID=A0A1H7VAN8_9PAST|nr:HNH endonuclease signature motif containing protein [Pasteurella skyensis]QLB23358.1 hypothetical protein A6B44_09135 [Pasteurella skyensis]SEM05935.1 HNH endonuclease [Pasteurella skyensis]
MKGKKIHYSKAELIWIELNQKGKSRKDLTLEFNSKFNRKLSVAHLSALCKRRNWKNGLSGQFVKGAVSWNKGKKGLTGPNRTSFKKGEIPPKTLPVGSTRLSVQGYYEIKISEPNKWALMHREIWTNHYGEIANNEVIVFKDGDKSNCDIENLMKINRGALCIANRYFSKYPNKLKETVYLMAQLKYKSSQRGK